jgi:hypothetical protein
MRGLKLALFEMYFCTNLPEFPMDGFSSVLMSPFMDSKWGRAEPMDTDKGGFLNSSIVGRDSLRLFRR